MCTLYNKLEELCTNKNISITKMCKETGISRASITDLKMGRNSTLSTTSLSKIAQYFNVSMDEILGIKKEPVEDDKLNPDLKYLIDKMQTMTDEEIKALGRIVDSVLDLRDK